jgi:hypothetical protein
MLTPEMIETARAHGAELGKTAAAVIRLHPKEDAESRAPEDRLKELFSDHARVSAWPQFRMLFAQISAQGNSDLPMLPMDTEFVVTIEGAES